VETNPKAFYDAEVLHVWTLGVAPYTDEKFKTNFRHNSFFVGNNSRQAVNQGLADYTPIFLSNVPQLFRRGLVPVNVALIQTSLPDIHGYMSIGISVDIVKAAVENASLVIAQVNANMPKVHGMDLFIFRISILSSPIMSPCWNMKPLLRMKRPKKSGNMFPISFKTGYHSGRVWSLPNAILDSFKSKKHLGVHTELLTDGVMELMKQGVIDNSRKTRNRGKSVATFCMGHQGTYEFIHDNPGVEFRTIDYTNNPLIIAEQENMTPLTVPWRSI